MDKVLQFELVAETKGAIRYAEKLPNGRLASAPNDPGACVGTLYIRKSSIAGDTPRHIEVRICDKTSANVKAA